MLENIEQRLQDLEAQQKDVELDVLLLKATNVASRAIQYMVEAVLMVSPQLQILGCNLAAERLLGMIEAQIIKHSVTDVLALRPDQILFKATLNIEEIPIALWFIGPLDGR